MRVGRYQMGTMADAYVLAILSVPANFLDCAITRSAHWRSEWSRIVDALVKLPHLQDRMNAPPVSRRDPGTSNWSLQRDNCPAHTLPIEKCNHRAREGVSIDLVGLSPIVHDGVKQMRRRLEATVSGRRLVAERYEGAP